MLSVLMAATQVSAQASTGENTSFGWLFLAAAAFCFIPAALVFLIFVFRVNRKLKAMVISGQRAALMQQNRSRVLAMIVEQVPLEQVLDALVEGAEQMDPSACCTVLLLDEQGFLHLASAPHLPAEYNAAIDGLAVGNGVGSCGTAAYSGQRVIVEDVRVHPYWQPYQALVELAGIRSCWSEPIKNRQGKVLGTFAIYHKEVTVPSEQDIQLICESAALAEIVIERSNAIEALKRSEERHRLLADHATDVIWTMDLAGHFTYISPSAEKLTGYPVTELMQQQMQQLITPESYAQIKLQMKKAAKALQAGEAYPDYVGEVEQVCKDGRRVWSEVKISGMYDGEGKFAGILGVSRDLTERRKIEERMRYMAQHDTLTGLPNRTLFADRLQKALQYAMRHQKSLALMLLDLNKFKPVNDTHGHAVGDLLLQQVAERLQCVIRSSDTVARIGGDEFIILLPQIDESHHGAMVAEKIQQAIARPFDIHGLEIQISCSIGLACYPQDGETDLALNKVADQRMYQQKAAVAQARMNPLDLQAE
ncbi:MAG: diguanylate cyclase [Gammaproteobacteria bacterium]|nr:diguanylate cyclase [Gammaproteobacteria bacterium]MBU2056210.1 diguanylate cyclase [Gammaproteobacteria bacterium]MBU2177306.1 diguanylate cyclase [Gammaproteobacteria bacterium]MBU2248785.1 diguanylate cyclase [Gammaproteobacteria bacterium]MBU2345788.1 diguanylate cyclase [Gammaproteobacteria bacterium]